MCWKGQKADAQLEALRQEQMIEQALAEKLDDVDDEPDSLISRAEAEMFGQCTNNPILEGSDDHSTQICEEREQLYCFSRGRTFGLEFHSALLVKFSISTHDVPSTKSQMCANTKILRSHISAHFAPSPDTVLLSHQSESTTLKIPEAPG